ncbi:alanine aminotransferase [Musa troglodytarum]|uniref:Alanine aminotransferase n=1 Tax=Musa troglodytarum TaxID=320322 RepID=A0A9E7HIZ9_9LILI|nr:alanine aminotransferase [Musa troglodytarum]
MVGSGVGGDSRSKEAVGMLALHEALRNVCLNSDWTYSVFWTIRPRPMLMWEDGFCRTRVDDIDGEDQVRKAFSKMSIQLYNYGEGLMGKVASDKCHKWVFKEPSECEPNIANYWQSSFDAIPEDLHFVLRMRHMFESLGYQSGFFLSQLFSSSRNSSPSPSAPVKQIPARPPPPVFNWSHPSLASNPPIASPAYHPSAQMGLPSNKDDTQLYLLPPSSEAQMDEMMPEQESDLKWPNGLSFFTALTGRTDDAKLLFGAEMLGHQPPPHPHPLMAARKNLTASSPVSICGNADELKAIEASGLPGQGNIGDSGTALSASNTEDLLSLESHSGRARKMENSKFKRSFTLPARMTTSSSSSSLDHHHASTPQPMDYRGSEAGFCLDIMETFLD